MKILDEKFGLRIPRDFSVETEIDGTSVVERLLNLLREYDAQRIIVTCGVHMPYAVGQRMKLAGVLGHPDKQAVFRVQTSEATLPIDEIKSQIATALGIESPHWFEMT